MSRSEALKHQIEQAHRKAEQARNDETVQDFTSTLEKPDVTDVTGVTVSNGGASGGNVSEKADVTDVTAKRPSFGMYETDRLIDGERLRAGVWFHTVDKQGDPKNVFVSSPVIPVAVTSNDGGDFGRLVRFTDTFGTWREWALPMSMLKGNGEELRGEFLSRGAYIDPDAHRLFNRYLMANIPRRRMIAATVTGWQSDKLFILPRQNIGEGDAIYQSEAYNTDDYGEAGSLDGWRKTIGTWCQDNPLLMLGVCTALAGPLLKHVKRQGAGFHIQGDSSTGKTTALSAGASVWGDPDQFRRTWRATCNGLEGVASQRNDTALMLDEIGEATGKDVGDTVYMLANGTGKSRANRKGGERKARRWRVMLLSSGERSLERHMEESGKRTQAGQETRLINVSAHRIHGAWDTLHGFKDGREMSDAIQRAAGEHYGHAGPAFIRALIRSGDIEELPEMLATISTAFEASGGQESRAAERFAVTALAGELAIGFGLLPVPSGGVTRTMVELFSEWKEQRGRGQSEDAKILRCVSDFIDKHGDARFSDFNSVDGPIIRDRAGWWKHDGDGRVYMFTSAGLRDAAIGYDMPRVTEALDRGGWIVERSAKERAKQVKVNGSPKWLYHIREVQS